MESINEILANYTSGEVDLDATNAALKEAGADGKYHLDPDRNTITEEERATHGLLDTGTGTLDKVEIKDMHLVNMDCGEMYALCIFGGKTYKVHGTALVEE